MAKCFLNISGFTKKFTEHVHIKELVSDNGMTYHSIDLSSLNKGHIKNVTECDVCDFCLVCMFSLHKCTVCTVCMYVCMYVCMHVCK